MAKQHKISWPQQCRAESSATAYRTVEDWLKRYSVPIVLEKLAEKIKEKEAVCQQWREQQEQRRIKEADKECHKQAAEMEE